GKTDRGSFMRCHERIDELVDEILETDRSPEELCAEHPELLVGVRARLRKRRAVEDQINLLFPIGHSSLPIYDGPPSIPGHEVQMVLGRGGMGIVYKARHVKLNRNVALKMLLSGSYASHRERERFVREAESLAALRHPNIVHFYEFGEVGGRPFYTM